MIEKHSRSFVSWLVYIPLQTLWVPISMLGAIMVGYRQLIVSKRIGVSQTAIEVFNARWTLSLFDLRTDLAGDALGRVLTNTSTRGLFLALFPLWVKWKIAGKVSLYPRNVAQGDEGLVDIITARTTYFDEVILRQASHVEQFVVLGAGYDTRSYGPLFDSGTNVFEVDQASVQEHKKAMLSRSGIDTSRVTFVTVDFSQDDLFEHLRANGFDATKPTLFLWEGVTLYLTEEMVRKSMADIHENAAKGSVLLADIYALRFIHMAQGKYLDKVLKYTNERVSFGLALDVDWEQSLATFVESNSWQLGARYFMGSTSPKGPYMVVCEMLR